jgi:hypothetical protein
MVTTTVLYLSSLATYFSEQCLQSPHAGTIINLIGACLHGLKNIINRACLCLNSSRLRRGRAGPIGTGTFLILGRNRRRTWVSHSRCSVSRSTVGRARSLQPKISPSVSLSQLIWCLDFLRHLYVQLRVLHSTLRHRNSFWDSDELSSF